MVPVIELGVLNKYSLVQIKLSKNWQQIQFSCKYKLKYKQLQFKLFLLSVQLHYSERKKYTNKVAKIKKILC
jgi:hypothetical protein